ncbi:MAG: beta-ketoacyl synthase N-terminal-like domain-containing protein, partial [Planctomycetota bacterium]|nr:beta-ketoacyl synthase N-terminal-like domain-containing protein [Planctomycetota bacterium]
MRNSIIRPTPPRIVITGLGFVAPSPLAEALSGRRAAPPRPVPEITAFEVPDGAPTWGFEVLDFSLDKELPTIKSFVDRTSGLALVAAKAALADAGLLDREKRPAGVEIGCSHGTTLGCLEAMGIFWHKVKTSNPRFAQPVPFTHGYANSPSSLLCIEYGLRGPAATFSGERLAGVEALMFAFDQIAAGAGEVILAGASESLTPAGYNHLLATGQLSRSGNWDDGIIPGEGAAMLVLESEDSARNRGARIHAEVEGVALYHFDAKSAPVRRNVGTDPRETVLFVSPPSLRAGGAAGPFWSADARTFSGDLCTGDMLSASPVLGAALGLCTRAYSAVRVLARCGETQCATPGRSRRTAAAHARRACVAN